MSFYTSGSLLDSYKLSTPSLLTDSGSSVGVMANSNGLSLGTGSLNTAGTSGGFGNFMSSYGGAIMGGIGAISSGIGAYFSAESAKDNLNFQKDMAAINARMAEKTAQSIQMAGEKEIGKQTLIAGKVKSSQKASQASRGVVLGEGSTAEEVATTDLMKEIDSNTINANTVRSAWAARTQSVNYANQSLTAGVTANSINPFAAGGTNLLNGATSVASTWYRNNKLDGLLSALGGA